MKTVLLLVGLLEEFSGRLITYTLVGYIEELMESRRHNGEAFVRQSLCNKFNIYPLQIAMHCNDIAMTI